MTAEIAGRYHGLTRAVPLEQHSLYRKIDRILAAMPAGRVLEVGCLDGRYLERLRERGWSVAGIDNMPQQAPYVVQHDAGAVPVRAEFDLVIAAEVIEHVVDTDAFLTNCAAVLRPGCTLILTTPNLLFGVNRLRMLVGKTPKFAYADYHVRMFVWDDLREKIERRFDIERVQVARARRRAALAAVRGVRDARRPDAEAVGALHRDGAKRGEWRTHEEATAKLAQPREMPRYFAFVRDACGGGVAAKMAWWTVLAAPSSFDGHAARGR
jgi:SAM-dependent methyltransferase